MIFHRVITKEKRHILTHCTRNFHDGFDWLLLDYFICTGAMVTKYMQICKSSKLTEKNYEHTVASVRCDSFAEFWFSFFCNEAVSECAKMIDITHWVIVHFYPLCTLGIYTVSQKKLWSRSLAITLSNLNRFQKLLHCCKEKEISNKPL